MKKISEIASAGFILLSILFFFSCTTRSNHLTIGFGKVNISEAGIYEDPVSVNHSQASTEKFRREEKFAISDRVEGRWRPGSGGTRKLVDSIYVSAMYGEDKNGAWAIITLDETLLRYKQLDHLKYPLIHELGLKNERLLFLPTHGHATPEIEPDKYQMAVFNAVKQAKENRSEVEIASLDLKLNGKDFVINRRVHVKGIGTRTVMFNDGCIVHDNYIDATDHIYDWVKNLGVEPERYLEPEKKYITTGEVDNDLQALFIRDKDSGEMKGSFIRFAAHAVIVSSKVVNGDVSADFPGYLKRNIENKLGGVALFGQGPCGDLRPLNKDYSHSIAKSYGENLASFILEKYDELTWEPLTKLGWYTEPVNLPLLDNLYFSQEELNTAMDELEAEYDKESNPMQRRILQNKFWGLYRASGSQNMIRPEWKEKNQLDINLFALQLNDKVILATQGEIFNRIGKEMIKPYSENKPILVSIANEYVSYIPTDEERQHGGYESSVSIVKPGSPELLVKSSHKLLERIYGN